MSRLRVAVAALGVALLTVACAAGQQAETANEKATIDGTNGQVGDIKLAGVALQAPPGTSYPAGADVPLSVHIANSGKTNDTLTDVSSSAFTGGWGVVATSSVPTTAATPSASSPSATPAPSAGSGPPQTIPAGGALGVGLRPLDGNGSGASPQTIVLHGLAGSTAPLFSGTSVQIRFTFARAGGVTLTVPVQLGTNPVNQSIPPLESSG